MGHGLGALGGEEEADAVVEADRGQQDGDPEGAEDLHIHADLGDASQQPDSSRVDDRLDRQQKRGEEQDRVGVGGIDIGASEVRSGKTTSVASSDEAATGIAPEPTDPSGGPQLRHGSLSAVSVV